MGENNNDVFLEIWNIFRVFGSVVGKCNYKFFGFLVIVRKSNLMYYKDEVLIR